MTSDYESSERPVEVLCTCGRQAVIVYVTERFGEVGYCGQPEGHHDQHGVTE